MTREEHIENLKAIASDMPSDKCDDWIESLMAGVKALEQEPTDAVDRVTIKEYLESIGTAYELGKENGLDIALDILGKYTEEGSDKIICDLPSVTPQPKMGKWIYRKEEDSYRCSLCNFPCHKDNLGAIVTRYCAGCGAVMEV